MIHKSLAIFSMSASLDTGFNILDLPVIEWFPLFAKEGLGEIF